MFTRSRAWIKRGTAPPVRNLCGPLPVCPPPMLLCASDVRSPGPRARTVTPPRSAYAPPSAAGATPGELRRGDAMSRKSLGGIARPRGAPASARWPAAAPGAEATPQHAHRAAGVRAVQEPLNAGPVPAPVLRGARPHQSQACCSPVPLSPASVASHLTWRRSCFCWPTPYLESAQPALDRVSCLQVLAFGAAKRAGTQISRCSCAIEGSSVQSMADNRLDARGWA